MTGDHDGPDTLRPDVRDKGLHGRSLVSPTLSYVAFNMRNPVIGLAAGAKGLALRKALALAVNRKRLVEFVLGGTGLPADQLIPPGYTGHTAGFRMENQKFDVAGALKLLKEAGFTVEESEGRVRTLNAQGEQVHVEISLRRKEPPAELLTFWRETGAAIGVEIALAAMSFAEFLEQQEKGLGMAYDSGWVLDYPSPCNMLQLFYGPYSAPGINAANFELKDYDLLFEKLRQVEHSGDEAALVRLTQRAQEVIDAHSPWIVLSFRCTCMLYSRRLLWPANHGFNPYPMKYHMLKAA